MKLLVFSGVSPYPVEGGGTAIGGAERSLRVTAETAAAQGHRVAFLTCGRRPLWRGLRWTEIVAGVEVERMRPMGRKSLRRIGIDPALTMMGAVLRAAVERVEPDIVLTYAAYPDTWLAVRVRTRVQADYGVVERVSGRAWEVWADQQAFYGRVSEAYLKRDASVYVSPSMRDYTHQSLAIRGISLGGREAVGDLLLLEDLRAPNARASSVAGSATRSDQAVIVFPAAFKERSKRQDLLLRALPLLRRRGLLPRVVFAGGGPTLARMKALARELGVRDQCAFVGPVGRDQLRTLMAAADLAVLLSDFEGLPKAAMEAMAAGVPTVMSESGWANDLVDEEPVLSRYCLSLNRAEEVAATIGTILRASDVNAAVHEATRRLSAGFPARFSPVRYVELLESFAHSRCAQGICQ